jgi:hypothetical protein
VTFVAPDDDFNSIGLADTVPAGWAIQVDKTWCTPNADAEWVAGNTAQYAWFGPYNQGQAFTALYKVTVPGGAGAGIYTFDGELYYHIAGVDQPIEPIAGDSIVNVQLASTLVTGMTREVNGEILPGVSITLDGVETGVSDQSGIYLITVYSTGSHTLVAHKDGFRDRTRTVNIAELDSGYAVTCDFQGQYGLIPDAPDMWYALDCVNLWLYPPNPYIGLDMWTALDVVNAWLYPITD